MTKIYENQVSSPNRTHRSTQAYGLAKKGGPDGFGLKTDDVVEGKVLRNLTGNKVLISVSGKLFEANAQTTLQENETHRFQVLAVRPQIVLKVLDVYSSTLPSALQLWAGSRAMPEQFARALKELLHLQNFSQPSHDVKEVFEALRLLISESVYDPLKADGRLLAQSLFSRGIFFENKLSRHFLDPKESDLAKLLERDLKGLILYLMKQLKEEGPEDKQNLMGKLQEALDFIERDQRLNLSSLREGFGWCWFLPEWDEESCGKTEIYGRRENDEGSFRLCMRLDLTHLGETEVNVLFADSSLNIRILMKEAEGLKLVEENLDILKSALKDAGLKLKGLSCERKKGEFVPPFRKTDDDSPSVHVVT